MIMADEQTTPAEKTDTEAQEQEQTPATEPIEEAKAPARFATEAIKAGATVRVSQKIIEGTKERIQVFEGIVLGKRGTRGVNQTITVRKVTQGFGVERIFPLSLPTITNIQVVKQARVRRAKLGYLRNPRTKKLKEVAA